MTKHEKELFCAAGVLVLFLGNVKEDYQLSSQEFIEIIEMALEVLKAKGRNYEEIEA